MKMLLLVVVLAGACLALWATPAFAWYHEYQPGIAYMHPFDSPEGQWAELKGGTEVFHPVTDAIPAKYQVWFQSGWFTPVKGSARTVVSRDFYDLDLDRVGGGFSWSMAADEVTTFWTPVYAWGQEATFNKDLATYWGRDLWIPVGKLPRGTYNEVTTETVTAMLTDLSLYFDGQMKPVKYPAGTYEYSFSFTVR